MSNDKPSTPESSPPEFPSPPPAPSSSSWKLPDGIEDHLTTGLIHTAIGATVGGVMGMVLFRSGGGWRAASTAAGVGVAWGSTYERMVYQKK